MANAGVVADPVAGGAVAASEPLGAPADIAEGAFEGGAGAATDEAGSGRGADCSPSLDGSALADCDGPSPKDLAPSWLPDSTLVASLFGASPPDGSSLAASAFGGSLKNSLNGSFEESLGASSPPGLPRLLSRCLADNLRPSGPRSPAACAGTWPSAPCLAPSGLAAASGLAPSSGASAGRASRFASCRLAVCPGRLGSLCGAPPSSASGLTASLGSESGLASGLDSGLASGCLGSDLASGLASGLAASWFTAAGCCLRTLRLSADKAGVVHAI